MVKTAAKITNVIMEAAQEHNPMSPPTPCVAAPALTAGRCTRVMPTEERN